MTPRSMTDFLSAILGDTMKLIAEAEAVKQMSAQYGLGIHGGGLLAMAMRLRRYARDCIEHSGGVDPTLWIIDTDSKQWVLDAEVTNSDCQDDDGYPNALRELLKRMQAASYLIVRETHSVKINMDMTLLEKRAQRDDPDKVDRVVCLFGESIDGAGLIVSYRRDQPGAEGGQIDITNPLASIVGQKWAWPGPHGAQFTDHGMQELMPRPEGK